MEQVWVKGIRRRLPKVQDPDVDVDIQILHGDKTEFLERYMEQLQKGTDFVFKPAHHTGKNYYHHACERAGKPKGKSTGESGKTRANSCEAYVSFKFIEETTYTAVVIRKKMLHTGHDPSSTEEKTKHQINSELLGFVEMWLNQGLSISQIVLKSCDWAHSHGYTDKHDRRYFVSPEDVRLVKRKLQILSLPDIDDSLSVEKLVTSELKENICYFQPLTKEQPLIIIVQTPMQKALLKDNPHPMVFMDASYKGLTSYGYALYALLLVNQTGRGVPFAYLIMSQESSAILELCLSKLCSSNPNFYPRSVMIDRDLKEMNAIKQVFPKAKVLLCWFHVLQAVHRWVTSRDGGNLSPPQRNFVMHAMTSMKACATEEDFMIVSTSKCNDLEAQLGSSRVTTYLKVHWFPYASLWANFGRQFDHNSSDTNNKAERFFLALKYQFLRGEANRRVDQLLRLLCGDIQKYYSYLDDLAAAGRLKVSSSASTATASLEKGLGQHIHIDEEGKCSVPSELDPSINKTVDLVKMHCDCGCYDKGNVCTHVALACAEAQRRCVDIAQLRADVAKKMLANRQYHLDGDCLTVYHNDEKPTFAFNGDPVFCTCAVNSYGEKCVCLHLLDCLKTDLSHAAPPVTERESQCVPTVQSELELQSMILDLHEWSTSKNFKYSNQLYASIKRAHQLAFNRFGVVSRKRKICALHAYRQRIENAKRCEIFKKLKSKRAKKSR